MNITVFFYLIYAPVSNELNNKNKNKGYDTVLQL